jgi:hypothetical protein
MVKFSRDSQYYHIVISKLSSILSLPLPSANNTDHNIRSMDPSKFDTNGLSAPSAQESSSNAVLLEACQKPIRNHLKGRWEQSCTLNAAKNIFLAELDVFKRTVGLTEVEEAEFKTTSFASLQDFIRTLQEEQERNGSLMYMKRLEPFLVSMQEYVEVVKVAEVFADISEAISYLWVSNSTH